MQYCVTNRQGGCNIGFLNKPTYTLRRVNPKVGRNELCPCGSGKKYKRCCINDKLEIVNQDILGPFPGGKRGV